jgi:NADH:ubiquinone oxidoreductase subunit 6 (subunit J)
MINYLIAAIVIFFFVVGTVNRHKNIMNAKDMSKVQKGVFVVLYFGINFYSVFLWKI